MKNKGSRSTGQHGVGATYVGTWEEIVRQMKTMLPSGRGIARGVHGSEREAVAQADGCGDSRDRPGEFSPASAHAGVLRILH